MTDREIRRTALLSLRQASPTTPQERHEGLSEFIRAGLVMVLLICAFYALTLAVAAFAMGAR